MRIFGWGIVTVVASYLGVALMLRWARRRQRLDIPNERSSHTTPTPHGGGLVIVLITLTALAIFSAVTGEWRTFGWFGAGGASIAIVSWFDDVRELPGGIRFLIHGIGAALAIAGFGYWNDLGLPFLPPIHLGWFGAVVTFVWIVGLTNAFNFMDGIDGIAGLQAVCAGFAWAMVGWWTDQPVVVLIGAMIGCSSIGFLAHNWSPARIFMGDVGSAFLGYSLAVLPLIALSRAPVPNRSALAGILIMWPFGFDAALTLIRRTVRGENVFQAHRSHLYQRMVIAGLSHRQVASLYGVSAAVSAIVALIWYFSGTANELWAFLGLTGLGAGLWLLAVGQERRHAANIAALETMARDRL